MELGIKHGKIEDSITNREILEDQLMDLITPIPSTLNQIFWNKYQESPDEATNYFYKMSQDNDYIKTRAIAKNISYETKPSMEILRSPLTCQSLRRILRRLQPLVEQSRPVILSDH